MIATSNSHQEAYNNDLDGFLVKFNADGIRYWASYYGGAGQDYIHSISSDSFNNIYIAGSTGSKENIISAGAFDSEYGSQTSGYPREAFLAKFDLNGNRIWGTYYGGSGNDVIQQLKVGPDNNLYMVGSTSSPEEISTPGTHQETLHINGPQTQKREDAFVAKFDVNGNRIWGTYFGGDAIDWGYSLVVDKNSNVLISGATQSTFDIAFNNAHQSNKEEEYQTGTTFTKFSGNGTLLWSTYYGGIERENYSKCAVGVDEENNVYLVGGTHSLTNISTPDAYQEERIGSSAYADNAYLIKFDESETEFGVHIMGKATQDPVT